MRLMIIAVLLLVGSFLPLFIVGTLDPDSNPIGLGLLWMAGSAVAIVLFLIGLVMAIWKWALGTRRPRG